jgi:hypothetical protein
LTELAIVLLFTVAGIGASLLALKLAEDSAVIRWLVRIFCVLAIANLGVHVWRVLAHDPNGAARAGALLGVLLLLVLAYRLVLRAVRRRRDRDRGPP